MAVACDPENRSRILGYLVRRLGMPDNLRDWSHAKAWCDPFRDLIVEALRAEMEG